MVNTVIAYLRDIGWDIELDEMQGNGIPAVLTNRYDHIPKEWL